MAISYTAEQLCAISAILARVATLTDWAGPGKSKADIQEIQCMVLDGGLYIAGNFNEATKVLELLNAFGVQGKGTFEKCLSYCHWLLTVNASERSTLVGRAYAGELSITETKAISMAGDDGLDLWLSKEQKEEAKALVVAGKVVGDARVQQLQAFLRKFVGLPSLVEKAPRKLRSGVGMSLIKDLRSTAPINVLADSRGVHAELKLLAYAYRCGLPNGSKHTITLGGLKKACANCASWISYFERLPAERKRLATATTRPKLKVDVPAPDPRESGGGAGLRPEGDASGDVPLAKLLFNGAANQSSADLQKAVS